MAKQITKQIFIIILLCIAIVLILALIFYQYIPSNRVIPAKVQAYSTPESIKTEIEDNAKEQELIQQNELFEITDSDLDQYRSNRSYNPGKSDPFSNVTTDESGTEAQDKGASSGNGDKKEKSGDNDKGDSNTNENTTDNYYSASNVSKGTK